MHDAADFQPAELELQRAFLQRLARQLVRGESAAEDLVQETFVRALERPPASATALRAWLASVARRLAINRSRGQERTLARERRVARPEAVAPHDEALASLELEERLIAAVKALDEPYRTTLWLRFHEGLAPGAIAARQGTTSKTVESRITRGLAQLRGELDRRSGGDRTQWLSGMLLLARGAGAPWTTTVIGVALMKTLAVATGILIALGLVWQLAPRPAGPLAPEVEPVARAEEPRASEATLAAAAVERAALERAAALVPAAPRGGLLVRVRWPGDEPAQDVELLVFPEDDPLGPRAVVRLRSDETGLVRASGLHPGSVRIEADRGGERRAELAANQETEVHFELAPGLDVEGTVTDASGAALAGAEVLLVAAASDWLAERVVARTRPDGSYRVRAAQPEFSLTARAESYAPALLQRLHGRTGLARIDFVLGEPAVGLAGRVLDPAGQPVPGALVAAGDPSGYYADDPLHPGTYLQARGLGVQETDARGEFFARGLLPGFGLPVAVQADGHPIAVERLAAEVGSTSFVEIALAPPAALAGFVRDSFGAPVPGVRVRAIQFEGMRAEDIPFVLPATVSDREGRFRLELLPAGRSSLRLDPPDGVRAGRTLVALALEAGENRRDLSLASDDAIRGRVVAPPGIALDGWFVRALAFTGGDRRMRRAQVEADGHFVLAGCDQPPYRVELFAATDRAVLRRDDAGPGEELVLVSGPLGSIRGEFVDEAGLLPEGARPDVRVSLREEVLLAPTWEEEGRFAFELLRAGRYRLAVRHAERLLFATTVVLAPGADVDLGRIASAPSGSLVLAFDDHPSTGISGTVLNGDYSQVAFLDVVEGRLGVAALPPGEWLLDFESGDMGRVCVPFPIRAGERTELRLALSPGVERSLSFRFGGREWDDLLVELRDARGKLLLGKHVVRRWWPESGAGPTLMVRLPVGTFSLEAETDTRLALRTDFDVPALVPQDSPLAFELR